MSLLAWWKLNGDLLDSSGNDKHGTLVAGSAVSFLDDGVPMAKSANFSTGASFVEVPKDTIPIGTGDITISYWYKGIAAANNSIIQAIRKNIGGDNLYYYQLNIHPRFTGDTMFCDIGANEGITYDRLSFGVNDTFLGWNHFVVVKNISKGTIKVYKNGVLFANGTGCTKYVGAVDRFLIGGGMTSAGANSYALPSNLQDLRIYDHVLSLREISELSKAKILHYTFDDVVDEPTINLLYNSGAINLEGATDIYNRVTKENLGNGKYKFTNTGSDVSTIRLYCNLPDLINGETYTSSVYYEGAEQDTCYINFVDLINSEGNQSTSGRLTVTGKRATYDSTYRFFDITVLTGKSIILFNPQIEKKDHATDFVNGTRTSGVVKDKSDYSNNAAIDITTVPAFVEADCRLGKQSIKLATKKRIVEPLVLNPKPMTISFWFKANGLSSVKKGAYVVSNPSARSYIIIGNTSGVIETSETSFSVSLGKTNTSYDFDMRILKGKEFYADNKWHNATIVIDGVDNRIYIDSVKEAVTFTFGSKTTLSGFCDTVCIGEPTGSSAGFEPEGVFIDDFRVYATVLSAEAIKDIYETRAFLDEKGLLVANRFELGNDTSLKVKENGDLVFSAISDSGVTGGLIAWYPLDGHARDVIGGNDGIVYGATVVGGQMQKCYNFLNTTDCVAFLGNGVKPTSFSASLWFSNTDFSTTTLIRRLLSFTEAGGWNIGCDDSGSDGYFNFQLYDTTSYKFARIPKTDIAVGWNFVTVSYDEISKVASLYLNGKLKNSITLTNGLVYSSVSNLEYRIGCEATVPGTARDSAHLGQIQDVRIYNRALTAAEVKINYEMSRPDGNSVMSVNNDILYVKSGISDKI